MLVIRPTHALLTRTQGSAATPQCPAISRTSRRTPQNSLGPNLSVSLASRSNFAGIQQPIRLAPCAASRKDKIVKASEPTGSDDSILGSVGVAALWIGLIAYVALLSPNQTPYRDEVFIKLLVGLDKDTTFAVNQIFVSVFNIMGIYPILYAGLLIPSGRSANKVPAWPFVATSFALGAFALIPYMALWKPDPNVESPPPKEELEGWNKLILKGTESAVLPGLLLAGAIYQWYNIFNAPGEAWLGYLNLFDESRLVHVTTLDFTILTALMPFWMYNDAEARSLPGGQLLAISGLPASAIMYRVSQLALSCIGSLSYRYHVSGLPASDIMYRVSQLAISCVGSPS
eukprot:gene16492-22718_t